MVDEYTEAVCKERHSIIKEKEKEQDLRLNNHGDRIDKLEQHRSRIEVQMESLMKKIDDLIGTLKWFLLGLLGSGGSFIVWQIKEVLTK